MATTTVMTVRIDNDLLASLKERAQHLGRSLSAEVVQMIRNQISPKAQSARKPFKSAGMFSQFEAPDLEVFQAVRRENSARINLSL